MKPLTQEVGDDGTLTNTYAVYMDERMEVDERYMQISWPICFRHVLANFKVYALLQVVVIDDNVWLRYLPNRNNV